MTQIAVVGTCVADILVRPVPLAQPLGGGRLFHVDPIEVTTGGIVCNTGIGLIRLGLAVAAASPVGDDPWGELIRQRLAAEGLDTASLKTAPGSATSTTAVLIDPSGERSFAHDVGACAAIALAWIRRMLRDRRGSNRRPADFPGDAEARRSSDRRLRRRLRSHDDRIPNPSFAFLPVHGASSWMSVGAWMPCPTASAPTGAGRCAENAHDTSGRLGP